MIERREIKGPPTGETGKDCSVVKNPPAKQKTWVRSLDGEDPWIRKWLPTPVFLPGESHGQRSLEAAVHGAAKSWTQFSD